MLMRKWRPPDVPAEDEWTVKYRVVIPNAYRVEILSTAHETPLAGHLGVNKTYQKILNHFYWPNLKKKDMAEFCKSCHTCKIVGKPNQAIPKAPLQPVPAFEEPFSRIITDCVGSLPKTRSGNQYLLTIICASTRFPEAIPLRIGNTKYVTNFDLLKGFWQVPLTDRAKEISAFVTPDGLFQYKVTPFGMKNSPVTFQGLINSVIAGLDGCEAYIDDVIIFSDTREDHFRIIRSFFERLSKAMLTINLAKRSCCWAKSNLLMLRSVLFLVFLDQK